MNLRWYVEERDISNKEDPYSEPKFIQSKPVLQYKVGNNNWITIPIVIERIEDGRREH